jgi:hypothetical protein
MAAPALSKLRDLAALSFGRPIFRPAFHAGTNESGVIAAQEHSEAVVFDLVNPAGAWREPSSGGNHRRRPSFSLWGTIVDAGQQRFYTDALRRRLNGKAVMLVRFEGNLQNRICEQIATQAKNAKFDYLSAPGHYGF